MVIKRLSINNFKNHEQRYFDFSSRINCFVGNNGAGKTNILDALHYLSIGKSFLGNTDTNNIKYKQNFFNIDALISNEEKEDNVKVIFSVAGKKIIKKNDKAYDRLSDHVGYLPSVIISPYDANLISDSGESRRKFLDAMIAQTDYEYLFHILQYQKTLKQRNALLKYFQKNRTFDRDSLEIYTPMLIELGTEIHKKRLKFIELLHPTVQEFHEIISGNQERVHVNYSSDLHNGKMGDILEQYLEKDRILTYTSAGVHKDDLIFEMNGAPLKKNGSQGQQKSFLIALKLAQIKRIKELTGKNPILLLDDIFDKLDDQRVAQLIELLNLQNFGQMFITDTHRKRTEDVVKRINTESKIFEIA